MSRFPRWWFWAVVLVPALVTAVGLTVQAGGIERRVEAGARAALPGADLVVDGRDVTISGIPVEQMAATESSAEAVAGVRQVSIVDPVLAPLRLVFRAEEVVVTGATEQQAWRAQFVARLAANTHGRRLVDETTSERGTDFPITTEAAGSVVALITQQPEEMTVLVDAGQVTISGVVPDSNRRKAIVAVLKRLFGDTTVIDRTTEWAR
ncbi:MAG: hypothetical protein ABW224_16620 [Kibdelosporangium sp.]